VEEDTLVMVNPSGELNKTALFTVLREMVLRIDELEVKVRELQEYRDAREGRIDTALSTQRIWEG
jgi:hypothetical protein